MSDSTSSAPQKDAAPAPKKSKFETIITLTPVVLTVLATILASRSAAEMTLAQYHRSVAGQNQSKVGDQWAFFQAKRVRGTETEMAVDRIPVSVKPGKLEPYHVELCGERLKSTLEEARERMSALKKAGDKPAVSHVSIAADAFQARIQIEKKTPLDLQAKLSEALKTEREKGKDSVFVYFDFDPRHLPQAFDVVADNEEMKQAVQDPDINKAAQAIADREPEQRIAELSRKVDAAKLRLAIDAAEAQGQAFEKKCEPYNDVIKDLNKTIGELVQLAADCHLAALEVGIVKPQDEMKEPANRFIDADRNVQVSAQELNDLMKTATHDFNQRRYLQEARNNQKTAALYEVQVHRNSMLSDNHLERSKLFSYAMMGTQAGVAIASLALAARRKSLLWLLAAFLGLAALAYSAWVFQSTMVR